jgi:hypothetical protein
VVSTLPALAANLAPGESLAVEVEYLPRPSRDTLELVAYASVPCPLVAVTPLFAGTEERARCTVRVPRLSGAPGATIEVPLYLDSAVGLERVGAREFVATISFDASLLVPVESQGVSSAGSIRSIRFEGRREGVSAVLARIPARVTLGRTSSTPITIDSFAWRGGTGQVTVRRIHGEFVLDSICREGGERLFDAGLGVLLRPIQPNPVREKAVIEYESSEPGRVVFELFDGIGRLARRFVGPESKPGLRRMEVDLSDVAAGVYLLVLRSGSVIRTQPVEVMP